MWVKKQTQIRLAFREDMSEIEERKEEEEEAVLGKLELEEEARFQTFLSEMESR